MPTHAQNSWHTDQGNPSSNTRREVPLTVWKLHAALDLEGVPDGRYRLEFDLCTPDGTALVSGSCPVELQGRQVNPLHESLGRLHAELAALGTRVPAQAGASFRQRVQLSRAVWLSQDASVQYQQGRYEELAPTLEQIEYVVKDLKR